MTKVSVIVPIYNCVRYVAQCVESLRAQTMEDFQAICVDDGSKDDSLAEARAAGFDMPKLAMLEAELRFLDAKNRE